MAKNLLARYVWVVDQLLQYKELTLKDLNELWTKSDLFIEGYIPERTFHNYRNAIEQLFDIEIKCRRRGGYHYYIDDIESFQKDNLRYWVYEVYSAFNHIKADVRLFHRIQFEDSPSGRAPLSVIVEAMRKNRVVHLICRESDESPSDFDLEPYCVKVFNRRWYVIGRNVPLNEIGHYCLDWVSSVEIKQEEFVMPKDFSVESFFEGCCGSSKEGKIQHVVVRYYNGAQKQVKKHPIQASQHEIARDENSTTYEYRVRPNENFIQSVLYYMSDVEILEPVSLRKEMYRITGSIMEKYKG